MSKLTKNFAHLSKMLRADGFRLNGNFNVSRLLKSFITQRTFRVIVTLRICQLLAQSGWYGILLLPVFMFFHRLMTNHASMDFSWRTQVGAGLSLNHGWGLVVNPKVIIGNNVTLFHGVTLGRKDVYLPSGEVVIGYPVLKDLVWVGPNAVIVGDVEIGEGSRIAGGAFVTESIPPYSMVVGNPAVIVKQNCEPDVMNRVST